MFHYSIDMEKYVQSLSDKDRKLLTALQKNAAISHADLAEQLGMSRSSCWRRIKELEDSGILRGTVAVLDAEAVGLQMHVMVSVVMTEHNDETKTSFESHVLTLPEVMHCYAVSGDRDYLLLVVTRDMKSYDAFLTKHILQHPHVRSAASSFALRQIKSKTDLPLSI